MQSQECFAKCSTPVLVPTRATRITLQEPVDRLRLLKIVGRLLEARNVFTLPHLPHLVSRLVNDCNKAVDSIDPGLTPPFEKQDNNEIKLVSEQCEKKKN
jgi:hypothetical protein